MFYAKTPEEYSHRSFFLLFRSLGMFVSNGLFYANLNSPLYQTKKNQRRISLLIVHTFHFH